MTDLTQEDLEIFDSSIGMTVRKQWSIQITRLNFDELQKIGEKILTDMEKAKKWDKLMDYLMCDYEEEVYKIIDSRGKIMLDNFDKIEELKSKISELENK